MARTVTADDIQRARKAFPELEEESDGYIRKCLTQIRNSYKQINKGILKSAPALKAQD